MSSRQGKARYSQATLIDYKGKAQRTLPKAVDFHPVTSRPIHVDFLRVGPHTKLNVQVAGPPHVVVSAPWITGECVHVDGGMQNLRLRR